MKKSSACVVPYTDSFAVMRRIFECRWRGDRRLFEGVEEFSSVLADFNGFRRVGGSRWKEMDRA